MKRSTVELKVLGGFELRVRGEEAPRSLSPRMRSAVTWLLLHRAVPTPRDLAAGTLWPDSPGAQARTNLRNLLHRLRGAAPELTEGVVTVGSELLWRTPPGMSVDLIAFEEGAQSATSAEEVAGVIALYQGPLLPGEDDEWLILERDRVARGFQALLERAVSLHEAARRYPDAIEAARRLLTLDPLREETHRALMRLYALGGDRAAALSQYRRCAETLDAELGIPPSAPTREAFKRLRRRGGGAEAGRASPSPRLIGRSAEWRQLQIGWMTANAGTSFAALIEGEAGIGKTRLAKEMLAWGEDQGLRTLFAPSHRVQTHLAFGTAIEILKRCALDALPPMWKRELAPLHPSLFGAGDPHLTSASPTGLRTCLFDAMNSAIALQGPAIICIDDIQWCDTDTLDWLNVLFQRQPESKTLWLFTLRTGESSAAQLGHLFTTLQRAGRMTTLSLGPLSRSEATALSAEVAARDLPASVVDALLRRSQGNPLFLIETIRAGLHTGELDGGALPRAVESIFEAKLGQLSEGALTLAELAAVMGGTWTAERLSDIAGMPVSEGLILIEELWERGIVTEEGEDRLAFAHDLIARYLYDRLSRFRRQARHLQIGEGLVGIGDGEHLEIALAARQFELGGMTRRAIPLFIQAGSHALGVHAYETALECLTHARTLMKQHPDEDLNFEAVKGQERAHHALGQAQEKAQRVEDLLELARGQRRDDWLAYAHLRLAELDHYRGVPARAMRHAEEAIGYAQASGDVVIQAEAALCRSLALKAVSFDSQTLLESLEVAEALARQGGLTPLLGTICARKAICLTELGRVEEADVCLAGALEAVKAGGNLTELARAWLHEGYLRTLLRQWDRAEQALKKSLALAEMTHQHLLQSAVCNRFGELYTVMRRLGPALMQFREALRLLEPYPDIWGRSAYLHVTGLLLIGLGEVEEGWTTFVEAQDRARLSSEPSPLVVMVGEQALVLMLFEAWSKAEALTIPLASLLEQSAGLALGRVELLEIDLGLIRLLLKVRGGETQGAEDALASLWASLPAGDLYLTLTDVRACLALALRDGGDRSGALRVARSLTEALEADPTGPLMAWRVREIAQALCAEGGG